MPLIFDSTISCSSDDLITAAQIALSTKEISLLQQMSFNHAILEKAIVTALDAGSLTMVPSLKFSDMIELRLNLTKEQLNLVLLLTLLSENEAYSLTSAFLIENGADIEIFNLLPTPLVYIEKVLKQACQHDLPRVISRFYKNFKSISHLKTMEELHETSEDFASQVSPISCGVIRVKPHIVKAALEENNSVTQQLHCDVIINAVQNVIRLIVRPAHLSDLYKLSAYTKRQPRNWNIPHAPIQYPEKSRMKLLSTHSLFSRTQNVRRDCVEVAEEIFGPSVKK